MTVYMAKVAVAFSGQTKSELSVSVNEDLVVLDKNVGSGWCKARNVSGQEGLVPLDFVQFTAPESNRATSVNGCDNDDGTDWDSDSDDTSYPKMSPAVSYPTSPPRHPPLASNRPEVSPVGSDKQNIVRKNLGKRHDAEDYILGDEAPGSRTVKATLMEVNSRWEWKPTGTITSFEILQPTKSSKLKGIKPFLVYPIKSSHSIVKRRYKQFDWLYETLTNSYPCVCLPPLPSKSITNRADDEFLRARKRGLQLWINRMAAHPIVSQSPVFIHFMTCTDKTDWKRGKRSAEETTYNGFRFFATVASSAIPLTCLKVHEVESDERHVMKFRKENKLLTDSLASFSNGLRGSARKDIMYMCESLLNMGVCVAEDSCKVDNKLSDALKFAGGKTRELAERFSLQPSLPANEALLEGLREHGGVIAYLPPIASLCREASNLALDGNRARGENRLTSSENEQITNRAAIIAGCSQAEMRWNSKRIRDESLAKFAAYFRELATFYRHTADGFDVIADRFA